MQAGRSLLVVVLGLPGTGKTTFARSLASRLGAVHLNTDMLRTELGLRGKYDEGTKASIYDELLRRSRAELARGKAVILDGTFYLQTFRDRIAGQAAETGAAIRWVEICAEPETVKRRVARRRPDSEADYAVYRKVGEAYEPLRVERLQLFSDRQTGEAMLAQALEYLGL